MTIIYVIRSRIVYKIRMSKVSEKPCLHSFNREVNICFKSLFAVCRRAHIEAVNFIFNIMLSLNYIIQRIFL